jgi:hypothetical protein
MRRPYGKSDLAAVVGIAFFALFVIAISATYFQLGVGLILASIFCWIVAWELS